MWRGHELSTHALSPSVSAVGCTGIHCSRSAFTLQELPPRDGSSHALESKLSFWWVDEVTLGSQSGAVSTTRTLALAAGWGTPFLQMLLYEMCQATVLKSLSRVMSTAWHGSHSIQHPSSESILFADELNMQSRPIVCRLSLLKGHLSWSLCVHTTHEHCSWLPRMIIVFDYHHPFFWASFLSWLPPNAGSLFGSAPSGNSPFWSTYSGETRRKAKVLHTNLGICWAAKAAVSNLYVAAEFHLASWK